MPDKRAVFGGFPKPISKKGKPPEQKEKAQADFFLPQKYISYTAYSNYPKYRLFK